MPLIEERDYFR